MILPLVRQAIGAFVFPVPTSNLEIFWTLLGIQFGYSFGSKLDQGIQAGKWFKNLPKWAKGIVKRTLDFTHHWWAGGFLWLYAKETSAYIGYPTLEIPILFFGFGLMIDDLRDIENLKRRYGLNPK